MRSMMLWLVGVALLGGAGSVWAHGERHEAEAEHGQAGASTAHDNEQMLTGEVVDVFCYLGHGEKGLGEGHASCAKKCIKNGLPVAIKVGDQLYLASLAQHEPANETLASYAGQQITVHGKVMERDGQQFIAISRIE